MHACQGVTPLRRSLASEDFVKASLANAALRHIDAHLQPPEDDLDHSVEKQRGISTLKIPRLADNDYSHESAANRRAFLPV